MKISLALVNETEDMQTPIEATTGSHAGLPTRCVMGAKKERFRNRLHYRVGSPKGS